MTKLHRLLSIFFSVYGIIVKVVSWFDAIGWWYLWLLTVCRTVPVVLLGWSLPKGALSIRMHFLFLCTIAKRYFLKSYLELLCWWKFKGVGLKLFTAGLLTLTVQRRRHWSRFATHFCSADSSSDWSHPAQLSLSLFVLLRLETISLLLVFHIIHGTCHLWWDMFSLKVSCLFFRGHYCHKGIYETENNDPGTLSKCCYVGLPFLPGLWCGCDW